MKSFFLLQAVLLWTTARGDESLLVNIDFPGSDIQRVMAPDADFCQLICTNNPQCTFFTFIIKHPQVASFTCFLKHTDNGIPVVRNPLANAISGFALPKSELSRADCITRVYTDVDFPGSDKKQVTVDSYAMCQRSCTEDPSCQFFTYATKDYRVPAQQRVCYLKSVPGFPSPPTINDLKDVVSGFSLRKCVVEPADESLLVNIDFPGSDIQRVMAPDAEFCQLICTNNPRCTFFTFVIQHPQVESFSCFLKHTDNGIPVVRNPLVDVISGFALPKSELSRADCITQVYTDVDFPGSDKKQVTVNSYAMCQSSCTEDPSCQFFTYATKDYRVPFQRRVCYLKSVPGFPSPPKINYLKDVVSGFSLKKCVVDYAG